MDDKPITWLNGEVKSPPFSDEARRETGFLLRQLQEGQVLSMPHSRPMPSIAPHVHELRIKEADHEWRLMYRIDEQEIVIVEVFDKKTRTTPRAVVENCRKRLSDYGLQKERKA
jgi:phage-related protein